MCARPIRTGAITCGTTNTHTHRALCAAKQTSPLHPTEIGTGRFKVNGPHKCIHLLYRQNRYGSSAHMTSHLGGGSMQPQRIRWTLSTDPPCRPPLAAAPSVNTAAPCAACHTPTDCLTQGLTASEQTQSAKNKWTPTSMSAWHAAVDPRSCEWRSHHDGCMWQ